MEKKCSLKGFGFNFEVNIFQILKLATNETSTLHQTICTWKALEIYNYNLTFMANLSRRVSQDRNCHRKSCLLNCWSLLL